MTPARGQTARQSSSRYPCTCRLPAASPYRSCVRCCDALCLQQLAFLGEFLAPVPPFPAGNLGKACLHLSRAERCSGWPGKIAAWRTERSCARRSAGRISMMRSISSPKNSTRMAVLIVVGQVDVHGVPLHTELVADKVHVVALVLQFDQAAAQLVPLISMPGRRLMTMLAVIDRVAQRSRCRRH